MSERKNKTEVGGNKKPEVGKTKKPKVVEELPVKTWVIYAGEEKPLMLVRAKTKGGALLRFEVVSGRSRDTVYTEEILYGANGYFLFSGSL